MKWWKLSLLIHQNLQNGCLWLGREFWKQHWAVFKRTALGGTEDSIVWKNTVIDNFKLESDFVMKTRSDWSRVGPWSNMTGDFMTLWQEEILTETHTQNASSNPSVLQREWCLWLMSLRELAKYFSSFLSLHLPSCRKHEFPFAPGWVVSFSDRLCACVSSVLPICWVGSSNWGVNIKRPS